MSFSVRIDALKLAIFIGDASGQVEARGVGVRHGRVSVIVGGRLSVGSSM